MTSMKEHDYHATNACKVGATPALTSAIELTEEELQNIAGGETLRELFRRADRHVTFNDTPTISPTSSGSTLGKVGKVGGTLGALAVVGAGTYEAIKHGY